LLLSHQVKTYHVLLLAKASGEGQQKNLGEKMLSKSLVLYVLFLDFKLKTMTMNGKPGKSLIDH